VCGVNEMSDELKEEIKGLKQEIANLKAQLKNTMETERRKTRGIYVDIGNRVSDYVEDVMESIEEGIHGELEKSIFIGPGGVRILRRKMPSVEEEEVETDFSKAAEVMNSIAHEHRLKILRELLSGGKYINELQEKLSEITTSTLSSHLNVLEKAGLVVQEKVRGRYLITMPGRAAYKMAVRITRFLDRVGQE